MNDITGIENAIRQVEHDIQKWKRHLESSSLMLTLYNTIDCVSILALLHNELDALRKQRDAMAG